MTNTHMIYGTHAVVAALKNPLRLIERLWVTDNHPEKTELLQLAQARKVNVTSMTSRALDEKLGKVTHQGVLLTAAPMPAYNENNLDILIAELTEPSRLLILDGVVDPHNLGACMRTADAAGFHAIIAPKDRACGITPIVRKVACGAAENIPFIQVTNLARTMRYLKEAGIWIYGLSEHAEKRYSDMEFSGSLAIAMGAEGEGLRRMTSELCDYLLSIPMIGSVESLNVSVATGIVLYEIVRQTNAVRT